MELREALKILRKELGMTQTELAEALHLNYTTVNRWENGKAEPNTSTAAYLMKYAKELQVSAECMRCLKEALIKIHKESLHVPESSLYTVERESICQLVDDASTGVYVCDLETNDLLYVNSKMEEYIGQKYIKSEGKKCYDFIMHYNRPCSFCPKTKLPKEDYTDEHVVSPVTGRAYHVHGKQIEWNGKKAHVQYAADETYAFTSPHGFEKLLDNVPIGIGVGYMDAEGRIEISYMNDGYYAMMGTTREARLKYLGLSALDAVIPEEREFVRSEIMAAYRDNRHIINIDIRIHTQEDTYKWVNMVTKIVGQENKKIRFCASFTDIDHLKS
ncbi:MAG: helix-turn-helix domain-containing protein [Clostridia bacterium]|nr:helix-turn-helix domain-containing protein [Clostridia bacterium]NCC45028.1 helix-turn-helix domain-containing protein [Clostridia bacterium]